jgi:hypothetical protein
VIHHFAGGCRRSLRRLLGRISPARRLPTNSKAKTKANAVQDSKSNPTTAAIITEPFRNAAFNLFLALILSSSVPVKGEAYSTRFAAHEATMPMRASSAANSEMSFLERRMASKDLAHGIAEIGLELLTSKGTLHRLIN